MSDEKAASDYADRASRDTAFPAGPYYRGFLAGAEYARRPPMSDPSEAVPSEERFTPGESVWVVLLDTCAPNGGGGVAAATVVESTNNGRAVTVEFADGRRQGYKITTSWGRYVHRTEAEAVAEEWIALTAWRCGFAHDRRYMAAFRKAVSGLVLALSLARGEAGGLRAERDEANRRANAAQTLCSNQAVMIRGADAKIAELTKCWESAHRCNDDMERAMLAAQAARDAAERRVKELEAVIIDNGPRGGHDEPCHYCGEPTCAFAGDPGRWPVPAVLIGVPERAAFCHVRCVSGRLKTAASVAAERDAARSRVAELEAGLRDALEMIGPCDTDNPRVRQWCLAHQRKRCDGDEVRARLAGLLLAGPAADPEKPRTAAEPQGNRNEG